MGARVTRALRNFNLENRAHREIGKAKHVAAPRYPQHNDLTEPNPEIELIHKKDDPLLSLLKTVYVESKDPPEQVKPSQAENVNEKERRPLKFSLPGDPYGILDITDVPKGKVSIVEALTALNSHKQSPKTWTPEKIAQDQPKYHLLIVLENRKKKQTCTTTHPANHSDDRTSCLQGCPVC
ncbi:hypothetical protein COCON_G00096800 [Conger conger]|uniref:NADH dehydrogenase [ubiquinone] 1 alpha subcomplex assembly factor 4 n=1 Tax=Conger conger TaxID=82655 RepID=A0A9Q1DM47_CONCO|nr:hypothetical protein COCON_G00096800 [Conger conger]